MNEKSKCDICICPIGEIKMYSTYQPTKQKYETHYVCDKCVGKLIEKHFSFLNTL